MSFYFWALVFGYAGFSSVVLAGLAWYCIAHRPRQPLKNWKPPEESK